MAIIQNSAVGNFSPKIEGTKTKQLDVSFSDVFSLPEHFEFFLSSLIVNILFVCLLVKETAEIDTRMADKSSWDQANIRQNLGLVWRNRKNIRQIIKYYFYLPFFLLIILCTAVMKLCVVLHLKIDNTNICNSFLRVLCAVYMLSSFIN